jgi:hypothetical protein
MDKMHVSAKWDLNFEVKQKCSKKFKLGDVLMMKGAKKNHR